MKLQLISFRYLLIFLLIFTGTNSRAQENYLYEHAVCFENGTFVYQQNGKYGFRTFEKQLSAPVYDTIFQFGPRYCVTKLGDRYFILGEKLEKRFHQPIILAERTIHYPQNYVTLKIVTDREVAFEYMIDLHWGRSLSLYASNDPFEFYPIEDNYYPTHKATNHDDYTINTPDWLKDRWVDSIRFQKNQRTYYYNGKSVTRKASLSDDYIGRYYISFSSEKQSGVIHILTGDTTIKLPKSLYIELDYYTSKPFFEIIDYSKTATQWQAYDTTGNLLSHLDASNVVYYEDGRIYEELTVEKDKCYPYDRYTYYNLYRFSDMKPILQKVIGLDDAQGAFRVFRSHNEPVFYLLKNDTVIGLIRSKKKGFMKLLADESEDQPENQLVGLTGDYDDDPNAITYFFTTKSGLKKQFPGSYQMYFDPIFKTYKLYYSEYDRKHPEKDFTREGIYDQKSDSILFADNEMRYQVGENMFITGDTIYQLVDFSGKRLSEMIIEDFTDITVNNRQYNVLNVNGKMQIYDESFTLRCEDGKLGYLYTRTNDLYKNILTLKRKNDPGLCIVNENLEPVLNGYFRDIYVVGNVLVVLNPDNSIQYLSLEKFK